MVIKLTTISDVLSLDTSSDDKIIIDCHNDQERRDLLIPKIELINKNLYRLIRKRILLRKYTATVTAQDDDKILIDCHEDIALKMQLVPKYEGLILTIKKCLVRTGHIKK